MGTPSPPPPRVDRLSLADRWAYGGDDPALLLFTRALTRWRMDLPVGARVLEIGCRETDLPNRLLTCDATMQVTGVDVGPIPPEQHARWTFIQGDINAQSFAPASFDAVISLGALEHVGLGFYGDPIRPTGDHEACARVAAWLKPKGWWYYDVPFQPGEGVYISPDRAWRAYGFDFLPRARGLSLTHCAWDTDPPSGTLQTTMPTERRDPFWFIATVWTRR